jgi:hypothetical protein
VFVVRVACGHSHTVVLDGNNTFLYFLTVLSIATSFLCPILCRRGEIADADM